MVAMVKAGMWEGSNQIEERTGGLPVGGGTNEPWNASARGSAVLEALRSGFSLTPPPQAIGPGATWILRARRGGRIVFRCAVVHGLRPHPRALPRELKDGHVVEV